MREYENYKLDDFSYVKEWKDRMRNTIRLRYSEDELSDKKLDEYLDKKVEERLNNRPVEIVNNYRGKVFKMTILEMIEMIRDNNLICAGGGCLFFPHGKKRNLLIDFILYVMAGRKKAKADRKNYPKGSEEWAEKDREQLAFKLIINSLYGCLGYPGFIMFNIFLAEAITAQGRHIITSAINAIENFLGDAMWFETSDEVYHCIDTIDREYRKTFPNGLSSDALNMFKQNMDTTQLPQLCVERYLKHCIFPADKKLEESLGKIFSQMTTDELLMMYFKNNFMSFSRLNFMKEKYRLLIKMFGGKPLMFCEDYSFTDLNPDSLQVILDLWDFYRTFVLYDYPIYDRLNKAMYLDKTKSLYTDTDSVFISLDECCKFITEELFDNPEEESGMSLQDLNFTAANITLAIANRMIDAAMKTLCRSIGIKPEQAKLLNMKNEFFFSRIMFTDVKKRYVSLALLQEGQQLYDDDGHQGLPEIKGFDFKKAGTKPFVRDFYTNLCLEEILRSDTIDPTRIFMKYMAFKDLMEKEIRNGNYDFFKQANVKKPEHYKNPYSTQGVNAVLLWNTLMPDKALDFPIDVNIIPIRDLTWSLTAAEKKANEVVESSEGPVRAKVTTGPSERNKDIMWYKEKHPEAYDRLFRSIYMSTNPLIQHMNLTSIAVPKNVDYEVPDYVTDLFDIESVINNALSLGIPLLKSIGIQSFQASSNVEHVSNMVSL